MQKPSLPILILLSALLSAVLLPACVAGNKAYDAGMDQARAGNHQAALASFDQVLAQAGDPAKNPVYVPALLARAESLKALDRPREALEDYRKASELAPGDLRPWIGMARLEEDLFLFDSAAAHFGRAAGLAVALPPAEDKGAEATGPDPVGLYMAQALNLSRTASHAQAARAYAEASALEPGYAWAQAGRAVSLALSGRCDQALEPFDRFLELMPGDRDGLLGRGLCRMEAKRYEGALADFEALLAAPGVDQDPDRGEYLFQRARALAGLDRAGEAVAGFAQVIALDPERAETVRNECLSPKALAKALKQAQDLAMNPKGGKGKADALLPVMECFSGLALGKDMPGCRQVLNGL